MWCIILCLLYLKAIHIFSYYFFQILVDKVLMLSSLIHLEHVFGFDEDNSWHYYFPHVTSCSSSPCNLFPQSFEISFLYCLLDFLTNMGLFLDSGYVDLFVPLLLSPNHSFSYSCIYSLISDRESLSYHFQVFFLFCILTYFLFQGGLSWSNSIKNPARDFVWNLYINWRDLTSIQYWVLLSRSTVCLFIYSGLSLCPSEKSNDFFQTGSARFFVRWLSFRVSVVMCRIFLPWYFLIGNGYYIGQIFIFGVDLVMTTILNSLLSSNS